MKIAFICASLEPGRDGVGDYTRRLAAACAVDGHDCHVLALNDRHVSQDSRELTGEACEIRRWPAEWPWAARSTAIREHLTRFKPDWISWQMVSYGYDPKGILGRELLQLAASLPSARVHVMLHEVWIGLTRGDSLYARSIGWLQRRALLAFLDAANPLHLHTSNAAYAAVLARHGWQAYVLPLFSNIPVVRAPPEARAAVVARYLPAAAGGERRLLVVTFGTLHRQWQPVPALRFLQTVAARQGRQPMLLALGRTGPDGEAILHQIRLAGFTATATGELDPATVSCLLQTADLGIAPHPWALINKSGVVAAMLDHGLPVLVPRDDWQLRTGPTPAVTSDPRLARLTDLSGTTADAWLRRRHSPGDSFPAKAHHFLAGLSAA